MTQETGVTIDLFACLNALTVQYIILLICVLPFGLPLLYSCCALQWAGPCRYPQQQAVLVLVAGCQETQNLLMSMFKNWCIFELLPQTLAMSICRRFLLESSHRFSTCMCSYTAAAWCKVSWYHQMRKHNRSWGAMCS